MIQSCSSSIFQTSETHDMVTVFLKRTITSAPVANVPERSRVGYLHRSSAIFHPGPAGVGCQELWWVSREVLRCGEHPQLEGDPDSDCGGAVQTGPCHPPGLHVRFRYFLSVYPECCWRRTALGCPAVQHQPNRFKIIWETFDMRWLWQKDRK